MKAALLTFFRRRPETAWALLIFILAFLQYANTLGHSYAWDDTIVMLENSRVQKGFAGIPEHFQTRARTQLEDFTGYRPVTLTTFSIEYALFGLNPTVGHLTNVLLFGLCCCVLFWTLRHLLPAWNPLARFCVALLFVVHPLHVEGVANIKSRDEILALLFGLLALKHFMLHIRGGNWAHLVAAGLFVILGTWSKENAILMLGVMGVAAFLLVEGSRSTRLKHAAKVALPTAMVVGAFLLVSGNLPGQSAPVTPVGLIEDARLGNSLAVPSTRWDAVGNSANVNFHYLKKFVAPHPLVYHSGYNQFPRYTWRGPELIPGWVITLVFFGLGIGLSFWRPARAMGFAILFYFITVALYLQLMGVYLSDTVADRFMFTPSVGLCLLVVALAKWIWEMKTLPPNAHRWGLAGTILLLALPLSYATLNRNRAWKDSLTLFETDMPNLENCSKAHFYLAEELFRTYDAAQNKSELEPRITHHYERAIRIYPRAYYAYYGLGNFYLHTSANAKAAEVFHQMAARWPQQADPHFFHGQALYLNGRYARSVAALENSRQLDPDHADTWEWLGRAYEKNGQLEQSMDLLEAAIPKFPDHLLLHDALSNAYFSAGDTAGSFLPLQYLIQKDPQYPDWWRKLIGRYQLIGDPASANKYYQQALAQGVPIQ